MKRNSRKPLTVSKSTVRTLVDDKLLQIDDDRLGQVAGGWSGGGSATWGGNVRICNG